MSNSTASIEVFYFDRILVFTTTGNCGSVSFWARLDAAGCGDKQFHEANVVVRGCLQCHQLILKVVVSTNSRLVVLMVVQEVERSWRIPRFLSSLLVPFILLTGSSMRPKRVTACTFTLGMSFIMLCFIFWSHLSLSRNKSHSLNKTPLNPACLSPFYFVKPKGYV